MAGTRRIGRKGEGEAGGDEVPRCGVGREPAEVAMLVFGGNKTKVAGTDVTGVPTSAKSSWSVGCSDSSAHRIISDLSAFVGHSDPAKHRILAAGDLNMFYGAIRSRLSLPEQDATVWARMQAFGLKFLGPQVPHGRRAKSAPDDVPSDTKNVPTFYRPGSGPESAVNQLDYAFASRGFHERVSVRGNERS